MRRLQWYKRGAAYIENYRSIIKDNTKHAKSLFKNQKNIAQNKSDVWALVARIMGIDCPAQGLPMPTWWAVDARVTGTNRPTEGHRGTCELTFPDFSRHFLLCKLER